MTDRERQTDRTRYERDRDRETDRKTDTQTQILRETDRQEGTRHRETYLVFSETRVELCRAECTP